MINKYCLKYIFRFLAQDDVFYTFKTKEVLKKKKFIFLYIFNNKDKNKFEKKILYH